MGIGDDLAPHGGFEIWYSDVSAFFGTKARTVLTGQSERTSAYAIDRTERGDLARGRYVSLRIYHPHKRLRLETMEVFGALPSAGRRLFETPAPQAAREPPPGFTPTPLPEPSPTPEPEPPPDPEEVQNDRQNDLDAWWNQLELSRRKGELYTRRVLPDAAGRSAAASVAVAITLADPGKSVLAGQSATLDAACNALGGCEHGDYWTSIHERSDADVDEDTRDPKHLPIDDAGWALQLLSRAIEPVVHSVIEGMLVCLSPALCAGHCDVCNEWVGLGNATAEAVLRETELRLHASTKQASRSVLDCVASFECLSEVATEVAEQLGDARELPATVRMAAVAKANFDLLEGARAEAKRNVDASWQVRRPARFALLRDHVAAVRAHEQAPLGEDDEVAEAGRRLAERPPPSPPPLTEIQQMMKVKTNETCRQLALKNATGAHDSHVQTTHLWMVRSLLDSTRTHTHTHTHTHTTDTPYTFARSSWLVAAMTRAVRGASASTAMCAPFTLEPMQPPHTHTHVHTLSRNRPTPHPPLPLPCAVCSIHHQLPPALCARGPRAGQDAPRRGEAARGDLRREEAAHDRARERSLRPDLLRPAARRHGGVRGALLHRPRQAHDGQARDARGAQDDRGEPPEGRGAL